MLQQLLCFMLSEKLYNIGKTYNLITKYNIEYDRRSMLDYVCAIHIEQLLNSKYDITELQDAKLRAILNNLVVL